MAGDLDLFFFLTTLKNGTPVVKVKNLELYPDLVFRFGIGWYFLGIFPTDTEGKLGRDISVLNIYMSSLGSESLSLNSE
jgi:hypothetical protein